VRALPFLETEDDYWSLGVGVELLPAAAPYRMSARGEMRDGTALASRLFTLPGMWPSTGRWPCCRARN